MATRLPTSKMHQRLLKQYAVRLCLGSVCLASGWACDALAQDQTQVEPPRFRLRTDANAQADAQSLREQLRFLVDSKGPINPLSDYGRGSANSLSGTQQKTSSKLFANQDPDAAQAPRLDADSAKRLQASGLTVPSSTLGVIALLPPPTLRSNGSGAIIQTIDDGFRPTVGTTLASYPISTPVAVPASPVSAVIPANSLDSSGSVLPASAIIPGAGISDGAVRVANYLQDDPIANLPPTLNSPPVLSGGTLPGGGSLPGSIPSIPQSLPQYPNPSVPSGIPSTSSAVVPGYTQPAIIPQQAIPQQTIPQSTTLTQPTIPPPTIPSNSVPVTVMPAPPTYYVPGSIAPQGIAPGMSAQTGVPYAGSPMPTYNRAGTFVNSAPFVSKPPTAVDARFMVSPAVWQQQANNAAGVSCNPSLASIVAGAPQTTVAPRAVGSVPGMVPQGVPIGVNGVTPTSGLVPSVGASPFAYAPPAAMAPGTVYAPSNGGFVPLVGFGQATNAQLGRGLYGQPTAYVNGQPIRNFLRYIFP